MCIYSIILSLSYIHTRNVLRLEASWCILANHMLEHIEILWHSWKHVHNQIELRVNYGIRDFTVGCLGFCASLDPSMTHDILVPLLRVAN